MVVPQFNARKVKNECVKWIKDWFNENGKDCNAIIGISGGKDSSIVAALCVEALGKDRVIGVIMPNGEQSDIHYAEQLVEFLDIKSYTVNIKQTVKEVFMGMHIADVKISEQTRINLPARVRMSTLYAFSQSLNGRVANTCNLSEDWIGYSTRYGDSAGDFSPLGSLTVTEVKAIGYELGLPVELIEKVPEDGLSGKTDEDNLGFSYEVLDNYIRNNNIKSEELKQKIDNLHVKNLFKLKPIPTFGVWDF